jgi:hypothetical protein
MYVRARFLDAIKGRWDSRDPVEFTGGDQNLYRYTSNRAIAIIDPTGRKPIGYGGLLGGITAAATCIASLSVDNIVNPCGNHCHANTTCASAVIGVLVGIATSQYGALASNCAGSIGSAVTTGIGQLFCKEDSSKKDTTCNIIGDIVGAIAGCGYGAVVSDSSAEVQAIWNIVAGVMASIGLGAATTNACEVLWKKKGS